VRVKSWDEVYSAPRQFSDMLRWGVTHDRLISRIVTSDRALEVGTGTSMLSSLVSKFCETVVSVDANADVLHTAAQFVSAVRSHVRLVQADAFFLPFADESFDVVFSQGFLEHFGDADVRRLIDEQLRVARLVLVSVPSAFYPHLGRRGPGLIGNERLMGSRRWRSILGDRVTTASYYPDFKVGTFGGVTLPWPTQLLLEIAGDRRARRGP
jgi:SAM-dependent methyltransferase